jgi:hypothetical protein
MSLGDIAIEELRSYVVRTTIASESPDQETRIIQRNEDQDEEGNPIAGFLSAFLGGGLKVIGWLFSTVAGGLGWTLGGIWSLFINGTIALYRFNWNTSDIELESYLNNMLNVIGGQLGGTVGNAAGFLVCGIIPAALLLKVNKAMAIFLLKEVGKEALDELAGNMAALVRASANYLFQSLVIGAYKGTRAIVRELTRNPNSWQSQFLNGLFGDNAQAYLSSWGSEQKKPWSFRLAIEESINNIPVPFIENFFEEAHEEFIEACQESGYVMGAAIDEWMFRQKLQETSQIEQQRIIELTPDRTIPEETILLIGNELNIREQIPNVLAQYRMVEDRDIGQFMGETARENIRDLVSPLTIRLIFKSVKKPPFFHADGERAKQTQITIPFINKNKIDWEDIKLACGGVNGYLWGRFRALVKLENGHSFEFWGASPQDCNDLLEDLLKLCTVDMVGVTITEETKKGKRLTYSALYKEQLRVYPCYFTIFNNQRVLNEDSGKATLTGVYKTRDYRFDLWLDEKPDNYQEIITDLLRVPGLNNL